MRIPVLLLMPLLLAVPAHAKATRYLTGNAADVKPKMNGPVLNLGGGGTDVDQALQSMIDQVRGCTSCATKVDVVILRSSGTDGYNDYIFKMKGVDSVETLLIDKRADANTAAVETTIKNAEVVFFAGGDQCNYIKVFKGTKVESAVKFVHARGGAIGGTSAGMAIQGDFTYDACVSSVSSETVLANPYDPGITFTYDFFSWRGQTASRGQHPYAKGHYLDGVLTDTHFVARDRMGRLMGFLARQIKDGRNSSALGIACDENCSVVVNPNGLGTVMGKSNAYFVLADHAPEQCVAKKRLTYSNFKIWRISPGGTFNLNNRPTTGYHTVSVTNGVLSANPY